MHDLRARQRQRRAAKNDQAPKTVFGGEAASRRNGPARRQLPYKGAPPHGFASRAGGIARCAEVSRRCAARARAGGRLRNEGAHRPRRRRGAIGASPLHPGGGAARGSVRPTRRAMGPTPPVLWQPATRGVTAARRRPRGRLARRVTGQAGKNPPQKSLWFCPLLAAAMAATWGCAATSRGPAPAPSGRRSRAAAYAQRAPCTRRIVATPVGTPVGTSAADGARRRAERPGSRRIFGPRSDCFAPRSQA